MRFLMRRPGVWHLLIMLGTWGPASAQTLFKCGNAYQDRPCDSEIQQRISATTGQSSGESYNPRSNAACARQGASAETIAEKRMAGVSLESALAALDARGLEPPEMSAPKDFVRKVYQREGAPPAVARLIEDACVAQLPTGSDYPVPDRRRMAYPRPQAESAAATAAAAAAAIAAADAKKR